MTDTKDEMSREEVLSRHADKLDAYCVVCRGTCNYGAMIETEREEEAWVRGSTS